ncbi:MAG: hypothetical protein LBU34_00915 [Planctomycetaceae bacterium]|nr:hypothetical protein [Planctomycetaceae bacterium]
MCITVGGAKRNLRIGIPKVASALADSNVGCFDCLPASDLSAKGRLSHA